MAGGTLENFGYNYPYATVTAGGTDTSSTTWTVGSILPFPAVSSSNPALVFHVADPANPSELITVTAISGTTWTVVRGAENTGAIAHAAGFTIKQVSPGINGYGSFYQMAGLGPTAVTPVSNTATATPIASVYVPSNGTLPGGVAAGVVYRLSAYGTNTNHSELASGTATISVYWDTATGTALASIVPGVTTAVFANSSGTAYPVDIEAIVSFNSSTTAIARLQMTWRNSNTVTTAASTTVAVGTQTTINGTSGAAQQLCIVWKWATAETTNVVNVWSTGYQIQ